MTDGILCFGELLLRLSAPGRQLLLQSHALAVFVGGAEANVAVALARLGHAAAFAGTVADNALGRAAVGDLRRHGVGTAALRFAPGRMGLYFLETGAGLRPGQVLYDRAGSAFALAPGDDRDWPALLAGHGWLHMSGITPALGAPAARVAVDIARAAVAGGVRVSFDGNYRPALWSARGGDAATALRPLFDAAAIAFADARDIDVVLGAGGDDDGSDDASRFATAAARAFAAFPRLRRIACTSRRQTSVDDHSLGARMACRDGSLHVVAPAALPAVVDRIGGGDAFAAGVLHGLVRGWNDADSLRFGHAAACLKHSVPGDFALSTEAEILALVRGEGLHVRR